MTLTSETQPRTETRALTLTLWRDHDVDVLALPGVGMGERPAVGDPSELAAAFYEEGVRRVAFSTPVDLAGDMDERTLVWAMVLLRELTSWGVVVDWRLRPGAYTDIWHGFNHLYPPAELIGQPDSADVLSTWRETFYLCKCIFRRGPGFIEVRDRRNGSLSRFVVDDPTYLAVIESLIGGAAVADLPADILADFVAEGLAGQAGELAWWLPYRVRRWPWPSMIV
jgi:hypothetical protein